MNMGEPSMADRPVELLQHLIRYDTSNPPGNEAECIAYINSLLTGAGINPIILAKDPARPNLVARIAGRGEAAPLLVFAHVDVVTTQNQDWKYPPFDGQIADGCVWGRGALDNKGGAAMSICAFLRMKEAGWLPAGDVILAIVCDEEKGGEYGSRYLVDSHPEVFTGVRYAIGEAGGFTFYIGKQKLYPIMVAEKQYTMLNILVHGLAQYATAAMTRGGTSAKTGELLTRLDKGRSPTHVTPVTRQMIEAISSSMPFPSGRVLRQLLKPVLTDPILGLLGPAGQSMSPLFHNTYAVIGVNGGEQDITTPAKIVVSLALGLLPSVSTDEAIEEVRKIAGPGYEYEILYPGEPGPENPNMDLFDTLGQILHEADPNATTVPLMLTAPSDARHYNRLGIQTYGFQPVKLPPEIQFEKLAHAPDERVPVEALEFGTQALYKLYQRFK